MCVRSSGPSISESTLHSKPLVIALAHLSGCWSLNERARQMNRERQLSQRQRHQMHLEETTANVSSSYMWGWHWGSWEQKKATFPAPVVSFLCSTCTCSCQCWEEKSKQSRTDRHEGGVVTDKRKKNQCSRRIVGFILTDERTVCDDKKFEGKQPNKIPQDTKKTQNSLRQQRHCEQCETSHWNCGHVAADAYEWHMGVFYNMTDTGSVLSKAKDSWSLNCFGLRKATPDGNALNNSQT